MTRARAVLKVVRRNLGVVGFLIIVAGSMLAYQLHGNDIARIRTEQTHLDAAEHRLDETQKDLAAIQKALIDLQTVNHAANCAVTQHEWDVLDGLIVKVDQADPGVRAQYEPLLGKRPVCTPLVVTTPTTKEP